MMWLVLTVSVFWRWGQEEEDLDGKYNLKLLVWLPPACGLNGGIPPDPAVNHTPSYWMLLPSSSSPGPNVLFLPSLTVEEKNKAGGGEGGVETERVWEKAEANERWKYKSFHAKNETLMGTVEREWIRGVHKHGSNAAASSLSSCCCALNRGEWCRCSSQSAFDRLLSGQTSSFPRVSPMCS